QFESERAGRLFAAGPLGEIEKSNLGMYILITKTEEEAREIAEKDPFHVRGIRKYDLRLWNFHESSILGVGVRAWLNGTDTSYRGYWPPQG
ncbi:MAG: YciI family protein, partial [Nitrospinota bacterium]